VVRTKKIIAELETRAAAEAKTPKTATATAGGALPALPTGATPQEIARRERLGQMRAEIESLERQIAHKETSEEQLRATLASYQSRIEQVPGVESEWIALTRDYDTQQGAYKDLLSKSEEAKVAAELEKRQIGEQFRILDPARTPIRPTGVNRLQVNAVGAGLGLVLGLALAAFLEYRDKTFRRAEDMLDVFQLPVLALVPRVVTTAQRRRAMRRRLFLSVGALAVTLAASYVFWDLELWKHIR
jgi:uncharacterized protein involved in exopolysaccharide biosynthesis